MVDVEDVEEAGLGVVQELVIFDGNYSSQHA